MREPNRTGRIVRQKNPLNLEFPFSTLGEWRVPTDLFYVRSHFPNPTVDADSWRLRVTGAVERPLELSLKDLRALPATTFAATMECAGNGRVYYEPTKEGLQWQNGAVGNADWTGVYLRTVLEKAGVKPEAAEVVLVGADRGVVDGGKKTASPGPIAFSRSVPIEKAAGDSVLLAYEMNREPLRPDHGFPLRAVVGGWFGMAWVKWITELRVVERPFLGYWQARDYFRWERGLGEPVLVPLTEMEVKAQIAQPVNGATVEAGRPVRIFGAAWSGSAPVEKVEVTIRRSDQLSVNSDQSADWRSAALLEPRSDYAWTFWEYHWTPTEPGTYTLLARASDAKGNVQPDTPQPDRESYLANWIVPVEVTVTPGAAAADEYVI
jgi:DMSO/TMAO reductase YedYZ molybdopterin-dependent catalytic subunit